MGERSECALLKCDVSLPAQKYSEGPNLCLQPECVLQPAEPILIDGYLLDLFRPYTEVQLLEEVAKLVAIN